MLGRVDESRDDDDGEGSRAKPSRQRSAGHSERETHRSSAEITRSVGEITAPLLAGFSFTTIFVVNSDTGHMLLPGEAITALTFATIFLIGAVQFAKYRDEKDLPASSQAANPASRSAGGAFGFFALSSADDYVKWTIRFYHFGIAALLAGFGLALAPLYHAGALYAFRWIASCLAFLTCGIEIFVYVRRALRSYRTSSSSPQGTSR